MAEADTKTLGGEDRRVSVSHRSCVPLTRLSRMLAFLAAVQRSAMFSPARCTTASTPSTALRIDGSRHRIPTGDLFPGCRLPAHQACHLVAARCERGYQRRADKAACASDKNIHGYASSVPMAWSYAWSILTPAGSVPQAGQMRTFALPSCRQHCDIADIKSTKSFGGRGG